MITVALYVAYLLAPIALLVVGSVGGTWSGTLLPEGLTGRWYAEVAGDPSFRRAFVTSLQLVGCVLVVDALLGLPLAYAIQSGRRRGSRAAARLVSLLPVAVPELVLAFGFILVFSTDALPWLGSFPLLVAAHVVVTLPYLVGVLCADLAAGGVAEAERVAASLGANFPQRLAHVVLPSVRHSLLSGLITVAALSIGEFQISNLVSGFLSRPYPVVLLQAFYGATGFACAATVVLLTLAVLAAGGAALASRAARVA